jgi:hypothetical protein
MRINQVIKSTDIFEDIVSQIPRGINDPRQVLTYGYSNLVSKIGLENAKRTNESYAAKILSVYYRQHLDEGLGTMLGKTAGHVAGAAGAAWRGLKGFWNDAKAGYKQAKSSWDNTGGAGGGGAGAGGGTGAGGAGGGTGAGGGGGGTGAGGGAGAGGGTGAGGGGGTGAGGAGGGAGAGGAGGGTGAGGAGGGAGAGGAGGGTSEVDAIIADIQKLDPESKKQLLSKLQAEQTATNQPSGTTPTGAADQTQTNAAGTQGTQNEYDPKKAAAEKLARGQADQTQTNAAGTQGTQNEYDPKKAAAEKLARGQADQQLAIKQMAAAKQANAQASQADDALKAQVQAIKAKPGFQHTAQDKITLKAAADKGIHENRKKKHRTFESRFLKMKI